MPRMEQAWPLEQPAQFEHHKPAPGKQRWFVRIMKPSNSACSVKPMAWNPGLVPAPQIPIAPGTFLGQKSKRVEQSGRRSLAALSFSRPTG